jgi:hypothetical protein
LVALPLLSVIKGIVAGAPEWIRRDLSAKEQAARERAEDAIAAMIASAIKVFERGDRQAG